MDPNTQGNQTGQPWRITRWRPPRHPPLADIPENIRQCSVYLKTKIWILELEAQIDKIEIGKSAAVAAKAQKELDIAKFEAGKLSAVITKLQRRLDRLQDLRSDESDLPLPLGSGSDDSWGPGTHPGRSRGRSEASRSDHTPCTAGSA